MGTKLYLLIGEGLQGNHSQQIVDVFILEGTGEEFKSKISVPFKFDRDQTCAVPISDHQVFLAGFDADQSLKTFIWNPEQDNVMDALPIQAPEATNHLNCVAFKATSSQKTLVLLNAGNTFHILDVASNLWHYNIPGVPSKLADLGHHSSAFTTSPNGQKALVLGGVQGHTLSYRDDIFELTCASADSCIWSVRPQKLPKARAYMTVFYVDERMTNCS